MSKIEITESVLTDLCMSTAKFHKKGLTNPERLLYSLTGMIGEMGELYQGLKGEDRALMNAKDIALEVGDVLWFYIMTVKTFTEIMRSIDYQTDGRVTLRGDYTYITHGLHEKFIEDIIEKADKYVRPDLLTIEDEVEKVIRALIVATKLNNSAHKIYLLTQVDTNVMTEVGVEAAMQKHYLCLNDTNLLKTIYQFMKDLLELMKYLIELLSIPHTVSIQPSANGDLNRLIVELETISKLYPLLETIVKLQSRHCASDMFHKIGLVIKDGGNVNYIITPPNSQ
jgi:hypothetical protein